MMPSAVNPVLTSLPKEITLKDGGKVTLRLLVPEDEDRLVALFKDISYSDLRELRDNVLDERVPRRWCRHINYDRVLPVVAEAEGRLVADATLHRRATAPVERVARFRTYVHPSYRHRGLGTTLLNEMMTIARDLGVKTLVVELFVDQIRLITMLEGYGFRRQAVIPAYQTVVLAYDVQ
jgi:GNAT superfamily N-acetyltransferase